jgi:hypothetical protein
MPAQSASWGTATIRRISNFPARFIKVELFSIACSKVVSLGVV